MTTEKLQDFLRGNFTDDDFLSHQEETALWRRWRDQGDHQARDALILAYVPLCRGEAAKWASRNSDLPREDLNQAALLALTAKLDDPASFEPGLGVRLGTYVTQCIRGALMEYALHNLSSLKLGTTKHERALFSHWGEIKARVIQENPQATKFQRYTRIAEIMAADYNQPNITYRHIEQFDNKLASRFNSLNLPVSAMNDSETTLQDFIAAEGDAYQAEHLAERDDHDRRIAHNLAALYSLPERERKIIQDMELAENPKTLAELGAEYGVSGERIRQLKQSGLKKMRAYWLDHRLPSRGQDFELV